MHVLVEKAPAFALVDTVVSRVWGLAEPEIGGTRALRTHISRLRRKLELWGFSIDVVTGLGWRIVKTEALTNKSVGVSRNKGRRKCR